MSQPFNDLVSGKLAVALLALAVAGCAAPGTPRSAQPGERIETAQADAARALPAARRAAPADFGSAPVPEAAGRAHGRAVEAMAAGRWLEAELLLEELVRQFPEYPGPYVNLAIVYAQDGRQAQAQSMLEQAVGVDPGHAPANNELGILLREQGKFIEAERAYRTAIEADPGYALAHYNLGVLLDVYLRRGTEALQAYERYQQSLPRPDETVARWIVDLRRRLGTPPEQARVAQGEGS